MYRVYSSTLLFAICILVGCGGGESPGKPVFPASGTVTVFGAPLADATIAFAPTAEGQPTAIGRTDKTGKFTLTTYEYADGAAEGTYKVVVTKTVSAAPAPSAGEASGHDSDNAAANSHAASKATAGESVELVPPQYGSSSTTPLTAEVKSGGENVFPFAIE